MNNVIQPFYAWRGLVVASPVWYPDLAPSVRELLFRFIERDWFYRAMAYIGRLLAQNGVNVIFAATVNRRLHRDRARQTIERFVEVYVRCSLETCMARDQKGIYKRELAGQATTVPGLQVPYEPPEAPEVTVDTEQQTPVEGVRQIEAHMERLSFLKR
jgi:adenylylsulfate kinase